MQFPALGSRLLLALLALLMAAPALAQKGEGPLDPAQPKGITVQEVIQKFAAKEKEFKEARDHYTYTQDIKVQTLDGHTVTGEYRQVQDVLFDDKGRRLEHVTFAPVSTLENGGIMMNQEDVESFRRLMPFTITSDELPQYDVLYVGQQREDELETYVFDVAPKQVEKSKIYFQGRIWVDNQDFQIVKSEGKTVPEVHKKDNENLFPKFTTWRQQIDGHYWFPVYTLADDILHFKMNDVHIREVIKYTNYKRFGSNVRVTYEGQEVEKSKQKPEEKKK